MAQTETRHITLSQDEFNYYHSMIIKTGWDHSVDLEKCKKGFEIQGMFVEPVRR